MKLSEAIRKGCKDTEKGRYHYCSTNEGTTYACALGAAAMAYTEGRALLSTETLVEAVSRIKETTVRAVPQGMEPTLPPEVNRLFPRIESLGGYVIQLNDYTEASREAIADWVELVEKEWERMDNERG